MAISNVFASESMAVGREILRATKEYSDEVQFRQRKQNAVSEAALRHPGSPLNISLSELLTLWRCRFGDAWISDRELSTDEYYKTASVRLHSAGQLERLTVHSGSDLYDVYRIRGDDADR